MDVQPTTASDNRQRLVAAGHQVLSERGIEAVTVKAVARLAGVSPGLFHYYFASKDELFLAIFDQAGERFGAALLGESDRHLGGRERIAAAVGYIQRVPDEHPELFRLRYEIYALGLRRGDFLEALNRQLGQTKDQIAGNLSRWFPDASAHRIRALAAVILACFDGLALQRIAGDQSEVASAYELLGELLESQLPS